MTKAKKRVANMRGGLWEVMVIQIAAMGPAVAHPFRGLGALGALGPFRGLGALGALGPLLSLAVASPFRGWGPGEGYGNAGVR